MNQNYLNTYLSKDKKSFIPLQLINHAHRVLKKHGV